jgi:hypothetical protein
MLIELLLIELLTAATKWREVVWIVYILFPPNARVTHSSTQDDQACDVVIGSKICGLTFIL